MRSQKLVCDAILGGDHIHDSLDGLEQRFSTFWYSRTPKSKIVPKLDYFSHK
jgi:hypothetical protein